jgi:hypothetical protein
MAWDVEATRNFEESHQIGTWLGGAASELAAHCITYYCCLTNFSIG